MSNDNIDASTMANVVNGVINALGLQMPSSRGVGLSFSGGAGSSNPHNATGNRITRYGDCCFVATIFGSKQFLEIFALILVILLCG